jgi:hypothetical protein
LPFQLNQVLTAQVKLFVNLLCTQKPSGGISGWPVRDLEATKGPWLHSCIKGYALGDRILAPGFHVYTSNIFELKLNGKFPVATGYRPLVQLAFSILSAGCLILQNLVHMYCDNGCESQNYSLDAWNELPQDFSRRVRHRLDELHGVYGEERRKKRCYLEHTTDAMK